MKSTSLASNGSLAEGHAASPDDRDDAQLKEQQPLRLLAPNFVVGSIIGRGGATIKEITQRTGAKVHISQSDESYLPDRLVTITAPTPEVILSAQQAIYSKIQEDTYAEHLREGDTSVPLDDRVCFVPVKMLVPTTVVGRLIGRGGSNLKRLMAENDAYIAIVREDDRAAMMFDHVVTVVGSVNKQAKAVHALYQQVKAIIESLPAQDVVQVPAEHGIAIPTAPLGPQFDASPPPMMMMPRLPNPSAVYYPPTGMQPMPLRLPPRLLSVRTMDTIVLYIPNVVVGAVIGRKGAMVKEIARHSRADIRVARHEESSSTAPATTTATAGAEIEQADVDRPVLITGTIESQIRAQTFVFTKIQEVSLVDLSYKVDMHVPADAVGRIIGRKGATVKSITESTGARLTINREEPAHAHANGAATKPAANGNASSNGASTNGTSSSSAAAVAAAASMAHPDAPLPEGHVLLTIHGTADAALNAQLYIREILIQHRQGDRM